MRTVIAIVTGACGLAGPAGWGWFHHAPREVIVERTRVERVPVRETECEPVRHVEYREVVERCAPVRRVVIERRCPPPPRCCPPRARVVRFEFCRH